MIEEEIMVIERKTLFAQKSFDGFIPAKEFDFESIILKNFEWMDRDDVENDNNYKQPIGYAIIYNPKIKKVFLY